MLIFLWLCLISVFRGTQAQVWHQTINPQLSGQMLKSATAILNTLSDVIKDSDERIHSLYEIKQDNMRYGAYEVGYVVHTIHEKYRKMVDIYNTSRYITTRLYVMELILYLEEIELHYWEIKHLVNMAHEIERKYKIKGGVDKEYGWDAIGPKTTAVNPYKVRKIRTKKFKWSRYFENRLNGSAASLQLQDLLNELSWTLKLMILKDVPVVPTTEPTAITTEEALPVLDAERRLEKSSRRVGMEALVSAIRRQDEETNPLPTVLPEVSQDENNMRLKLFKLMYETVRDSDLKVKRAELIQDRYKNDTSFQVGYLMGDVTDKFGIMTDIATTLERFYGDWKPIEHINAYEQIANQAIEVSHLIDLMRAASKKDSPSNLRHTKRI